MHTACIAMQRRGAVAKSWRWAIAISLAALTLAPTVIAPTSDTDMASVIIRAKDGAQLVVQRTIEKLGGSIGRELPLIDGYSARVPTDALPYLNGHPAVLNVSLDEQLRPMSITGEYSTGDLGSMRSVAEITRAVDAWGMGYSGRGVDIAMIDTGVAPSSSLTSSKVVHGADLSFDVQTGGAAHVDAYGHGTHLGGIAAGRDSDIVSNIRDCRTCTNGSVYSDTTKFVGIAPDARIVNVKVGAYDGATDVSQVIAGIDWVVRHASDDGLDIRVLLIAYGTDGVQDYRYDPLSFAVEQAWKRGIFVVVAAGNDGTTAVSLANPARNPFVMSVGASTSNGTLDRADDGVAPFASRGTPERYVDLIAPGVSVISTRSVGSYVEETYPEGLVGTRFMRGSGTSQAAAVVAGAAALVYDKFNYATPDGVKTILTGSAYSLLNYTKPDQGKGLIDIGKALKVKKAPDTKTPALEQANGTGSLEASRGSSHLSVEGLELSGERGIFGQGFDTKVWADKASRMETWNQGLHLGHRMSGDGWVSSSWATKAWENGTWAGTAWTTYTWNGKTWDGQRWSGQRWSGQRWSSDDWTGQRWSGQRWSSAAWS